MRAIRVQSRAVDRIREVIAWPWDATEQWCKGFLAGIFDAEGSCSGSLRIPNTDRAIVGRTTDCLRRLGFRYVIEDYDKPNGLRCVRLLGGTPEQLRFFHTVDPAITRKRSLEGRAIKFAGDLRVASIEPLGVEMPMYDITTGHGRLHRQRRRLPQLLRAADARVPGLQRGAGLRARDRRQGQRAGGAPGRARASVVGARVGGAGHEHRPVPVGRGPLQAHARDLGGVPGLREPVLDPDQVAAAAARSGPDEGDREGDGDQRLPVGADAGREGVAGDRAAHAAPTRAAGGRGGAQSQRNPDGRARSRR